MISNKEDKERDLQVSRVILANNWVILGNNVVHALFYLGVLALGLRACGKL